MPPLALTGERTLPDIPAENYWYRRHLAVYRWIASRVSGQRVLDMACGEGYGSAVLADKAATVVGVEANPEAHEHARLRYRNANLSFARGLVETYGRPGEFDCVAFLQTIEHVHDPEAVLRHLRELLRRGGSAYISTPNVLTLAPPGADKSGNPWHLREYRAAEFISLCRSAFDSVEPLGVYHARKLLAHEYALKLGWDRIHTLLRITRPFYDRFVPAIHERDFVVRAAPPAELQTALDLVTICRP